jgi:hypothetical protein
MGTVVKIKNRRAHGLIATLRESAYYDSSVGILPRNSMADPKPFTSISDFLFNGPLYAKYVLARESEELAALHKRGDIKKIDGYCLRCKNDTTYTLHGMHLPDGDPWRKVHERQAFDVIQIVCGRESWHTVRYNIHLSRLVIQKVGQHPSLADIAIDETRNRYRSVLTGDNWSELYKAIGLAAHGEGIGSFVYLRRVFERLIYSRFSEFRADEGWDEDKFRGLRMDKKVEFLKGHLPSFLVENRRIYGIFSQGIHELDNETCLQFFDVGKESIMIVLEDDVQKKAELDSREKFKSAISKFTGASADADPKK